MKTKWGYFSKKVESMPTTWEYKGKKNIVNEAERSHIPS